MFSQLYAKGLVYKGLKVMPVSTGCATTLANFEAGQNYKVRGGARGCVCLGGVLAGAGAWIQLV